MKQFLVFLLVQVFVINTISPIAYANTDFPKHVTVVKSESNKTVSVEGKLEDGQAMEDLS